MYSRREFKTELKKNSVTVNGERVSRVDHQIDAEKDEICLNGVRVEYNKFVYLMLNKPKDYVCATEDKNCLTVLELIPKDLYRTGIFPAGRLDKTSTGMVILTNDGKFAHKMLSPKSHVPKLYEVTVDRHISQDEIEFIKNEVTLADGYVCKPAKVWYKDEDNNILYFELEEGKYHQIKRMLGRVECGVDELKRVKIGGLSLPEELEEGDCISIMHNELDLILCKVFEEKA